MLTTLQTFAQVKIGSAGAPNSNAVLDLDGGTSRGLLLPRITTADMNGAGFATAPNGVLIYNSTDGFLYLRKGAAWQKITDATNNGSFALPYSGSIDLAAGTPLDIMNTNSVGGGYAAIRGQHLGSGIGLAGYSAKGTGINGSSQSGDAAYFSSSSGNALITGLGRVGIGTPTPTLAGLVVNLKVGAINAMFGSNTTGVAIETSYPGIAFNSYYSSGRKAINTGYGSLVGQDPTTGRFYISTSAASITGQGTSMPVYDRLVINPSGNVGIEGNTNPGAPLSFANTVGNKIALWGDASTLHYGIGIQGALMQLYTNASNADISLGYGSSTSFTEKYRFGNNGYFNIKNGRIRFTGQFDASNSHGIEFTNFAGNALRGFIGQFDDNNMGFYGYNGAGWALLFNQATGQLNLGATRNANDLTYKLNVGGKILAEEVRVQLQASWPDYVFDKDYNLMPLGQVQDFVKQHAHLPGIPAAADVEDKGMAVGEMQRKMMEKIEELTLYIIELKKEVDALKAGAAGKH